MHPKLQAALHNSRDIGVIEMVHQTNEILCCIWTLPATKMNEITPFSATWMGSEIISLSEVNHTEKDKYMTLLLKLKKLYKLVQFRLQLSS